MANNNQIFLKISIDGKDSISVIRELEIKLKAAKKEIQDLNLQGEVKSKTEQSIKNLSTELDKLKANGGGAGLNALRKEAQLLDLQLGSLTKGTVEYSSKLTELGLKKKEISELGKELKLIDPENRVKAMIGAGAALTASFTAVQGILNLVGSESEEVDLALKKVVSGIEILASVSEIAKQKENIGLLLRIAGYKSLSKEVAAAGTAQAGLNTATQTAAGGFSKLKAAIISTGLGAFIVLIGLAIANADKLKEAFSGISKAQESINKSRVEAGKAAAEEQSKVAALVTEYKSANTSALRRKEIIDELQSISPNYFGSLNKEKVSIEQLTGAYDKWSKAILLKAQTDALAKNIADNNVKIAEIQNSQITDQVSIWQTLGNAVLSFGNAGAFAVKQVESGLDSQKEKTEELTNTNKVLQKELEKTFSLLNKAGGNTSGDVNKANEDSLKSAQEKLSTEIKFIEERKKQTLENNEQEYSSAVSTQTRIEEENRLSYERQKADLSKFTEEKKTLLLTQSTEIAQDTTLGKDDRAAQLKIKNEELKQLEQDYQDGLLQLDNESLQKRKELNTKSESDLLKSKQQQLESGLKVIEEAKQKELALINQSSGSDNDKLKQRNAVVLQAAKDKAALEQKIEVDKNKIIEDSAKQRAENEANIINQSAENARQTNEKLIENLKTANEAQAESAQLLIEQQTSLRDSLVQLYTELKEAVFTILDEAKNAAIDSTMQDLARTEQSLMDNRDRELASVQDQYDRGVISKEQFEKKKSDIEKTYNQMNTSARESAESKKLDIERRYATAKKIITVAEIGINTIKEVAKIQAMVATIAAQIAVLSSNPITLSYVPVATGALVTAQAQVPITIAVGAAQAAAVLAKKFQLGGSVDDESAPRKKVMVFTKRTKVKDIMEFERMASGKITKGTTSTADDVPIMASKGEFMVRASAVERNYDVLNLINKNPNVKFQIAKSQNQKQGVVLKYASGGLIGNTNPVSLDGRALVNNTVNRTMTDELLKELILQNEQLLSMTSDNIRVNQQIRDTEYKARVVESEITKSQNKMAKIRESTTF
ncbi:MAG: hypothetical protein U0Y08_14935 [Bacteroidia bacterium]